MRSDLAKSYGQDRLPRYTSYPTAPHFSPAIGEENYRSWLKSMPVREPAQRRATPAGVSKSSGGSCLERLTV